MYFLWAFTNDANRLEEFSWCKGQPSGNDKWKNLLSSGNEVSIGSSSIVLSDQWLNTKKEHSDGLFWNCEILLFLFSAWSGILWILKSNNKSSSKFSLRKISGIKYDLFFDICMFVESSSSLYVQASSYPFCLFWHEMIVEERNN